MHSALRQLLLIVILIVLPVNAETENECFSDWKQSSDLKDGYYYNNESHKCVKTEPPPPPRARVFISEEMCAWKCRANTDCLLQMNPGDNSSGTPRLMYYYNREQCQCTLFLYKGFGGNGNRFETLRECLVTCEGLQCITPPNDEEYICSGRYETFHYNQDTNTCQEKKYGCHRGGSNFKTAKDCQRTCLLKAPPKS
uniref:Putative monolaris n=1 Tax=Amblyomma parvum TaxID=251391 RepID=A0A023FYY9_AMBPA